MVPKSVPVKIVMKEVELKKDKDLHDLMSPLIQLFTLIQSLEWYVLASFLDRNYF